MQNRVRDESNTETRRDGSCSLYRVGVDTGGTFTDVVVADEKDILAVGKALTTRSRISEGILEGLAVAAEQIGLDVKQMLNRTGLFIYGTTRATNAIIEQKTAKTALLVTEGFPDILVRKEGGKVNPWDFTVPYPEPYIPRRLTREIPERVTAEGDVVKAFDETRAREILEQLEKINIEAIAVCFLWSVVNPAHEEAMGRLIEEVLPGLPYTLSHQLNPIVREYRRASSAAIDASLKPLMQEHLREMERDLRHAGLEGDLLPATSFGGVMYLEELVERPIHTVRSGPALAPVIGQLFGKAEAGASEVIVCDTGGTSFDVSLIRKGRPVFTRETWLGPRYEGHLTGLSSIDVRSIGSGGGSIAWIDSGGLLRVGPESAGAEPGPACYGRGGARPTVTDAAAVLGYLDPDYFLGGRMTLDVKAARTAMEPVARALGTSLEAAAHGILTVASEHMVEAIKEITVNEGVDPRESLLLAGGGAAGMNIIPIARELGCDRILLPRMAGALSACGAQYSNIVAEFVLSGITQSGSFDFDGVNTALDRIKESIRDFSERLARRGVHTSRTDFFVEARYLYQAWDLELPLTRERFNGDAEEIEEVVNDFHVTHEMVFAVKEAGQQVEFTHWKGRLTGFLERPSLEPLPLGQNRPPAPTKSVKAYFHETGLIDVPVYRGDALKPGVSIWGPALILEPTTSVVIYPQSVAALTALNNYMLETHVPGREPAGSTGAARGVDETHTA